MDLNRLLKLLDVLCASLPERSLRLAVPLLPLLRSGVNLNDLLASTVTIVERMSNVGELKGFRTRGGKTARSLV